MKLRIGPPATGDNFYKRPALIQKLRRTLEGSNLGFLGPRRTGKTSCLEEIKAQPGPFLPILLNLEKHDTVEAWLSDMLHQKLEPVLSQTATGIEELDHVLDTLKHDGYLVQEGAGPRLTRFGSNIVRDFWLRKTA